MSHVHVLHTPGHYIGQVRGFGCRLWRTVTRKRHVKERAMAQAIAMMCEDDHRARVLWVGGRGSYYDPHVVMEARRR